MDIGTAIIASYSANLIVYITITVGCKIKNYIVETYYS